MALSLATRSSRNASGWTMKKHFAKIDDHLAEDLSKVQDVKTNLQAMQR